MWAIILNASRTIYTTCESSMSPFPAVLVLGDARIYVYTSDSCNVASNAEASVDEILYFGTTLKIPNVNSNNSHIRFRRGFNNLRIWDKYSIIENISCLKSSFNYIGGDWKVHIFDIIENVQDLEIQFQLRKSWTHYIIWGEEILEMFIFSLSLNCCPIYFSEP